MCGIVGVAGNLGYKEEDIFADLLLVSAMRGKDSTGIISVPQDTSEPVQHIKKLGNPYALLGAENTVNMLKRPHNCLIGHNRFATTGDVIVDNAHPFKFDHITGVHNGTLTQQYLLPDWREFDVDSANIFYTISKEGIEETVPKLGGAYTLVWFDAKSWSLNFIRNKQRPLFYALSEDGNKIYWASEAYMLHLVLTHHKVKNYKVHVLPEDTLFEFHFPEDIKLPLNGPVRTKLEGHDDTYEGWGIGNWVPARRTQTYKPYAPVAQRTSVFSNSEQKTMLSVVPKVPEASQSETDAIIAASKDMDAEYAAMLCDYSYQGVSAVAAQLNTHTTDAFGNAAETIKTCSMCDGSILPDDPKQDIGEGNILCINCYTDEDTREAFQLHPMSEEEVEEEYELANMDRPMGHPRIEKADGTVLENANGVFTTPKESVKKDVNTERFSDELKDVARRIRKSSTKNRKKKMKKLKKTLSDNAYEALVQLLAVKGVIK